MTATPPTSPLLPAAVGPRTAARAILAAYRPVIVRALRAEVVRTREVARVAREVAERVRAGEAVESFRPGEDGAEVAEELARVRLRECAEATEALAALDAACD